MIRGTLQEFSLAEIIRLIAQTRRTGALEIKGPIGSGQVLFRDGAICGAQSTLAREPLGRKLVRSGVLSESQLWNALSRRDKSAHRLGETLVTAGLAAPQDVDAALREQVEDSIVDVLRLEPTEFKWKAEAGNEGVSVVLSAEDLLASLTDRLEEVDTIRRHIPSEDSSVSLAPMPPAGEIRLTPDDWRVLVFLGARRTVRDLLHYSGAGETQMLRSLDRLVSAGLIEVQDRSAVQRGFAPDVPVNATPSHSSWHETGVIRLPDGGAASLQSRDVFKVAVVGSSARGLSPLAGALLAKLAEGAPVDVSCWSTSGPPPPGRPEGRHALPPGPRLARPLRQGQLKDMDLVIGLDWANVGRAVRHGSARPEVTFTILELWALADAPTQGHAGPRERARGVVERANARRIHHAELLTTLEMAEPDSGARRAEKGVDPIDRLEEVCERVASILFAHHD